MLLHSPPKQRNKVLLVREHHQGNVKPLVDMREASFVQISSGSAVKAHRCTGAENVQGSSSNGAFDIIFLAQESVETL